MANNKLCELHYRTHGISPYRTCGHISIHSLIAYELKNYMKNKMHNSKMCYHICYLEIHKY